MCTYLNWPRSLRCVQCYTKRANASDNSPSQDIGAISVTSFKQQQPTPHSELEQNINSAMQKHKRFSDNLDPKSIIDCGSMAEAIMNNSQHLIHNPQQQLQERLNKLHIATNIDAEMNASNNAASANAAATGAAAQRLSPVEGSTTHLNNLANSSQTQQQQQLTSQSTSTSATTSSSNPQQPNYIKKWACNVSFFFFFNVDIREFCFFVCFRHVLMKTFQKVSNARCAAVLVISIVLEAVLLAMPPIALRIMPAVLVIIKQM